MPWEGKAEVHTGAELSDSFIPVASSASIQIPSQSLLVVNTAKGLSCMRVLQGQIECGDVTCCRLNILVAGENLEPCVVGASALKVNSLGLS